jgi:hypothetical protein
MIASMLFVIGVLISVAGGLILHYFAQKSIRHSIFWAVVLFILTCIGAGLVYKQTTQTFSGEAFDAKIPISIKSKADDNLITAFMFQHGLDTAPDLSPINFSLYMQITNLQNVASKIVSYGVQCAPGPDGPWKSLMPVLGAAADYKLYMTRNGLARAVEIAFEDGYLDKVLHDRSLGPGETVSGWAFFERRDITPNTIKFYRFHARDLAGVEGTKIITPIRGDNPPGKRDLQIASIRSKGKRNISKFHIKYAHTDPYPD